jgi:branched-chain amino acid transport system substrate-binding protein
MRQFNKDFGEKSKAAGFSRMIANHTDASGYDIVNMFVYAMKKANVTGDKDKLAQERIAIRDILEKMEPLPGVLGSVNFAADHDARMPIYIIGIKDSKTSLIGTFQPK